MRGKTMNKKVSLTIALTMIFLTTFSIFASINTVSAVLPSDQDKLHPEWYTTVNGVLADDFYSLYPYELKSASFGFSKFGELIGIPQGMNMSDPKDWIGMDYDGRDPFCPNDTVPMNSWINGWYMWIEYTTTGGVAANKDRHLFAFAMFSDGNLWGGDWQWAQYPDGAPYGGRKTNGTCVTEPLTIIYHGPRRFVAQSVTHVFDKEGVATWPVVDVYITIIFNKDKKEIIILKDIKITIDKTHLYGKLNIQLSNREEYDLGPRTGYASFAHFFENEVDSKYDKYYETSPDLMHDVTDSRDSTGLALYTLANPLVEAGYIKVYVDGVFQPPTNYDVDYIAGTVTFRASYVPPVSTPEHPHTVTFKYKHFLGEIEGGNIYPDVAQVISADRKYVAWAGFWPEVSDYTVDGLRDWLHPLDEKTADMDTEPKQSPLVIGEWDFLLDHEMKEYRCVEVKGISNWHDADDTDAKMPYWVHGIENILDKEAHYQLEEVFAPWSLEDVFDKDTSRWVMKESGDGETTDYLLKLADMWPVKAMLPMWPNVTAGIFHWATGFPGMPPWPDPLAVPPPYAFTPWDHYCTDGERVLVNGVLMIPDMYVAKPAGPGYKFQEGDYRLWIGNDGNVYVNFTDAPPEGSEIKILFSINYGAWEWMVVGRDSAAIDSAGATLVAEETAVASPWTLDTPFKMAGLDMQDAIWGPDAPYVMSWIRGSVAPEADKVQVRPGNNYEPSRSHYRAEYFGPCHGKSGFKDDWSCHNDTVSPGVNDNLGQWRNGVPIASASIVTFGSPYANMATEYFNEFTDAYLDVGYGITGIYPGQIVALTCLNKPDMNTYLPEYDANGRQLTGYGVISTYKDINGTIGVTIWGYTGQDTYYTCWSILHSELLYLAGDMGESAEGVTTMILKFDYTLHPTDYCFVSIVEALGTISEYNAQLDINDHLPPNPPPTYYNAPFPWWPEDTWITDKIPTIHPDP